MLAHRETLRDARVLVAVAGMEGALPSLVAGLVDVPVVAVPTSIGYGAHFGGVAPLLTMLNSCAGGIGVVNIDNGFGAAVLALAHQPPVVARAASATAPDGTANHAGRRVIGYLDCSTGVSGDKFLGALLDAGSADGRFTESTCSDCWPRSPPKRELRSSGCARAASPPWA